LSSRQEPVSSTRVLILFFLLSDRGPVGEIVEADSQRECE